MLPHSYPGRFRAAAALPRLLLWGLRSIRYGYFDQYLAGLAGLVRSFLPSRTRYNWIARAVVPEPAGLAAGRAQDRIQNVVGRKAVRVLLIRGELSRRRLLDGVKGNPFPIAVRVVRQSVNIPLEDVTEDRQPTDEIASIVLFLAADDSGICTNQNYIADGGWV